METNEEKLEFLTTTQDQRADIIGGFIYTNTAAFVS